jgi:hypothetical protein
MLAHAGGAAALDLPPWLVAYGAAAVVLLVTVTLRGRVVAAGSDAPGGERAAGARGVALRRGRASAAVGTAGRVVGCGALAVAVGAALAGPEASAANLAPSAVVGLWWAGLPLACVVAGDVMRVLDPFGTVAALVPGARTRGGRHRPAPAWTSWTAPAMLAAAAWWMLAYHDARSPRALGAALVAYTTAAVAGVSVSGPPWLRWGEGFGALSWALARLRHPARCEAVPRRGEPLPGAAAGGPVLSALVAVWLGAVAFDLFTGTRAWVEVAGATSGWTRTGRATGCLVVAMGLAGLAVIGTSRLAAARRGGYRSEAAGAATLGWLSATAGIVVAHGLPVLLLEGQFALALVSDPFGRGWDLFGTARRTVDYSPLSPGLVGTAQIVAVVGGAAWGVMAARRVMWPAAGPRADARATRRVLWAAGIALALAAASAVGVLAADLE